MAINHSELLDFIKQSDITAEDLEKIVAELRLSADAEKASEQAEVAEGTEEEKAKEPLFVDSRVIALHQRCAQNRGNPTCPRCGCISMVKNGHKDGRQRYICKDCKGTCGDTYNTIFYRSHLSYEKLEQFIKSTLLNRSLPYMLINHNIATSDGWFHRHQLLSLLLKSDLKQDNFPYVAEADEYYTPLSFKGIRNKSFFIETLKRMPRHYKKRDKREAYLDEVGYDIVNAEQLDGYAVTKEKYIFSRAKQEAEILNGLDSAERRKRGISNEQVCVLTCVDKAGNTYIAPTCLGRVTPKYVKQHFESKFDKDSVLVTDSHVAYRKLAEDWHISLKQIPSGSHKINGHTLSRVNSFHSRLDTFENYYRQVASKYLDHYLALYRWQDKHRHLPINEQVMLIFDLITSNFGYIEEQKLKDRAYPFDTKNMKLPKHRVPKHRVPKHMK